MKYPQLPSRPDEHIVRKAQIDDDGTQCGCFAEDYLKSGDALADCTQADGHDALADKKLAVDNRDDDHWLMSDSREDVRLVDMTSHNYYVTTNAP
ncbi:hypothetical protein WN943_006322 [Citrus x changshan-huyou]